MTNLKKQVQVRLSGLETELTFQSVANIDPC